MERKDNIGYKTPEGYFENLHDSIMDDLPIQKETKVFPMNWLKVAGVAASIIMAVVVINPFEKQTVTTIEDTEEYTSFEELTAEEFYDELFEDTSIEDYITFDNSEIIEL